MNRNEASEALAYPVDEAVADAARWIEGVTMYGGMRGWRAACAVLAAEVQVLRAAIDEAMILDPEVWAEVADADAGETFGQEASDA